MEGNKCLITMHEPFRPKLLQWQTLLAAPEPETSHEPNFRHAWRQGMHGVKAQTFLHSSDPGSPSGLPSVTACSPPFCLPPSLPAHCTPALQEVQPAAG